MDPNVTKTLYLALITFFLFSFSSYAQQTGGTVSGTLVDAATGESLGFANVGVTRKGATEPARSMQTDIDGKFKLTGLSNGTYSLKASYVGYSPVIKDTIIISATKRDLNLGAIKLKATKSVLKEVNVAAQKSQIKLGIDKKSFDVSQSLVSQGGSATDLLANVPSVQVDADGNLSLRGSANVRVLINGKPSTLTGSNLTDILQSIPASAIETIEVITNPSSKYDAEGQSGLINIVMKKNAQLGFTGSATMSAGTQNTYNGTLNLAYQTSKINVYGNYSYRVSDRIGNGFTDKNYRLNDGDTTELTNQVNNQTFHIVGQNIRSGIDFFLDQKNTLSFSDNINIRSRNLTQDGTTMTTLNGAPYQNQYQNNINSGTGTNMDYSLDLDHKFKKKQEELTANIGYSRDANNTHANLYTATIRSIGGNQNSSSLYDEYTTGLQHNITLQTDYTLPLTDGKFEAGYRGTFQKSDNNYIVDTLNYNLIPAGYEFSSLLSNDFIYQQNIEAVYSNYQHQFGKFGMQAGLRLEDADISTQLTTNNTVTHYKQDYFRIYPTLFLTDKLTDNETLQLSYSRRVTRPNDRQLTPFLDVSNKQNYQQGNPNLLPEDTHSVELSYINYWTGVTLTSSLYYRLTNDNIQQIITPLTPTNLTTNVSTFENIASATNAGYELIAKITASQSVDLTANLNAYYSYIDGYAPLNLQASSGYAWNGNLTANIKASKKFSLQLRGDYQAPQPIEQGRMLARYGMDGGLKYDISKTLTLSMNSRDIFNTRKFETVTHINNAVFTEDQTSSRRFATRSVLFTLSFHIGQSQINAKRNKQQGDNIDNPNQDDPNAGGGNNGNNNGPGGTIGQQQGGKGGGNGTTGGPPKGN